MFSNAVCKAPCLQNCKLLALFPSSNFDQIFGICPGYFLSSPTLYTTHIHLLTTEPLAFYVIYPLQSSAIFLTPSATICPTWSMPHHLHWCPCLLLVSSPSAISPNQHSQKIKVCMPFPCLEFFQCILLRIKARTFMVVLKGFPFVGPALVEF